MRDIYLYPVDSEPSRNLLSVSKNLVKLENSLAEGHTCAFNTVQSAVQATLELLGTRVDPIPVVMPVTSAPDTMSAVLRAGAHPILLDINENDFQMDAGQLAEVLEYFQEQDRVPIGLLNRPFGRVVRPDLLELVNDIPSILDARMVPHPDLGEDDVPCAFNIFSLDPICGQGGVVIHGFKHQVVTLKHIRSGSMGLNAHLPEAQAKHALAVLKDFSTELKLYEEVCARYSEELDVVGTGSWPGPVWVRVKNVKNTQMNLLDVGVRTAVAPYALYELDEIRRRYAETPEYPVAAKVQGSCIALPAHHHVADRVDEIIEIIKESNV